MNAAVVALAVGLLVAMPALAATFFLTSRAKVGEVWQGVAEAYKEEVALRDETIERLRDGANLDRERVAALEAQVSELGARDQKAVLAALQAHEVGAEARAELIRGYQENAANDSTRIIELLERIASGSG